MSHARINSAGTVFQLDARSQPHSLFTSEDAKDPEKAARAIQALIREVEALRRGWRPRTIVFEDVTVSTAGASVKLAHNFNGRVRWWLAGWRSSGTSAPVLKESTTATTDNMLVLLSYVAGTATIHVEEAG